MNPLTGLVETKSLPEWETLKTVNAKGKTVFPVTSQVLFQSHPKLAPYETSTGVYPVFADVVRQVAA
jgi:hypothetical protein